MINVAIAGISGRMGRALLDAVMAASDMVLHAALDRESSVMLGFDAGALASSSAGASQVPVGLFGLAMNTRRVPSSTRARIAARSWP